MAAGGVRAEVRRATIFSGAPSRSRVFRELRERAAQLGADAVVNARAGGARVTGMSWGSRRSIGQAVKFLTDAEIRELYEHLAAIAGSGSRTV